MASRKIFAFIFCSLLSPISFSIRWLPNILEAIFYRKYNYYDFHITSLRELLVTIYEETFIGASIFSLVLIFIPFQLIKDSAYKKGKSFSFLGKIGILSGIIALWILVFGLFSNIWTIPWYKNFIYLIFAIGFGLFFCTLLHFTVDRYEDKRLKRD